MRVLFWVPYPTQGASNRYRIEQYLPYLEKEGIDYCLRPFWGRAAFRVLYKKGCRVRKIYFFLLGTLYRLWDIFRLCRFDLVFIHREAYPVSGAFFETVVSMLRKPIIFDFDDAIYLAASSPTNNFIERFKRPEKVSRIIKMSRHVVAGNSYLAEFASRYNKNVSIIPTPIDTAKYAPSKKEENKRIVIGWIGSVTTLGFLASMKEVFKKISHKFEGIEFRIIGGEFKVEGLANVFSKPWQMETETEDLKSFDIGIMPMPDNAWTRGKCGFKAIIYMSMGIPCVCSPVGANKEIISDGINGFLAGREEEWLSKLSLLITDSSLRQKIGSSARKSVEERFSVTVNVPKFLSLIR